MRIIVISIAIIAQGVASLACFTVNLLNEELRDIRAQ